MSGEFTAPSGEVFDLSDWKELRASNDAQVRETARALGESLRDLLELRAHLRAVPQ